HYIKVVIMAHNLIIFLNSRQICHKLDITGAYVKIGYFEREADLIFQDEVHGNLFEQVEGTIDLLFTKYIKAIISYDEIHRNETYEYPKEAVREALLNAIAHKDYSGSTPIQIRVYPDKLMILNSDYQRLNSISKRTATTELTELSSKFKILIKTGTSGSSISYKVAGQ